MLTVLCDSSANTVAGMPPKSVKSLSTLLCRAPRQPTYLLTTYNTSYCQPSASIFGTKYDLVISQYIVKITNMRSRLSSKLNSSTTESQARIPSLFEYYGSIKVTSLTVHSSDYTQEPENVDCPTSTMYG
jgi:hypothetical protein